MKKLILFLAIQLIVVRLYSQAPPLINYQAVARDAAGAPITGQAISVKFEFKQGSTAIYSETQSLNTNALGLFSTQIGKVTSLGSVNWQAGATSLEVSIDPAGGSNFITFSSQQLVSVPYALHAATVPSSYADNVLMIGGKTYTLSSTSALQTSVTATSGIATITSAGTNTFDVNVPAPVYNAATGALTTGTSVTNITPSLTLAGGILTSGPASNSVTLPGASSPTITGAGISTVVTSGNNYTVNVATPTLTGLGTTTVSGAYPNYTINTAAPVSPTLTGLGTTTVSGAYPNYTINTAAAATPTLTGLGTTTVTGAYPNYSINTSSASSPIITGVGVSTVTSSGNNYTVNVATPTLTGLGTTTVSGAYPNYTINTAAAVTPTLTGLGTTTVTGSYPNYSINTSSASSPTITGVGVSTVTSSGNNYTVNVATPTLTGLGTTTVTGSYPNYSINTASASSPTITGVGVSTVTSSGNNYTVNVATPTLTGLGTTTVSGAYPNYTINTAAAVTPTLTGLGTTTVTGSYPNYSINTSSASSPTITGVGVSTVTSSGNNYTVNVATPTLTGLGTTTVSGAYPNYTINTAAAVTPTLTGLGTTTVSGTYPNYTINTAAAVTPTLTGLGTTTVTGSYPNYSINTSSSVGPWAENGGTVSIAASTVNVGIGTGTPAQKLDVAGNVQFSGALMPNGSAGTAGQVLQSVGTSSPPIWVNTSNGWGLNGNTGTNDATNFIGTTDAVGFVIKTNNSEAVHVDKSGNVGINGLDPDSKFTVNKSASGGNGFGVRSTMDYVASGPGGGHASSGLFTNNFSGTGGTQVFSGISGVVSLNNGANTSQYATGGWLNASIYGGTHSTVHGVLGSVEAIGGSVTNAYAGRFEFLGNTPATNAYGAYVGTVNGTNKWSFYASDATAPSYFAGDVRFGGALVPSGSAGTAGQFLQSSGPGATPVWANVSGGISGGTSNYVTKYSSASTLVKSLIFDNGSSVGINTNSPNGDLHINSVNSYAISRLTSSSTSGAGLVTYIDNSGAAILNYENSPIYFGTNGSNRMIIDATGNVGIGTITPGEKLDVSGNAKFSGALMPNGTAGTAGQYLQSTGAGAPPVWAAAPAQTFAYSQTTGSLTSGTNSAYITPTLTLNGSTLTSGPSTNSVNLNAFASPWVQTGGTVSIASNTVNVAIGGASSGALLSLNNNSVTSRNGLNIIGTRDQVGSGIPINIEIVTIGQTFGSNTYGRVMRMTNNTLNSSFDMGIDQNSSFFLSRLNQFSPAADFAISSSGYSGFGKSAPTERIDVNGNVRFSGALMPNNAAGTTGQILQSAGPGAAPVWTTSSSSGWDLTGNATTTAGINFIGTTDGTALLFKVNSVNSGLIDPNGLNTFFGYQSGNSIAAGVNNTGIGWQSLRYNTSGSSNTAFGSEALVTNSSANFNSAFGRNALYANSGSSNNAFGTSALYVNTGTGNSAFGSNAMQNNGSGSYNTAVGNSALLSNTVGVNNSAFGYSALNNSNGGNNTGIGYNAMSSNSTGSANVALGYQAGQQSTGSGNVFIGANAGASVTTGSDKLYIANTSTATLIYGDFANKRVGINNVTASEALDVTGNVRLSGALMPNNAAGSAGQYLRSAGAGAPPVWATIVSTGWVATGNAGTTAGTNFIGTTDAQDVVFKSNNAEVFRVLSAGVIRLLAGADRTITMQGQTSNIDANNLMIRASDAGVGGQPRYGGALILQGGDGYNQSTAFHFGGSVIIRPGKNQYGANTYNSGNVVFQTVTSTNAYVEAARIDANGNLGIGTTIPSEKLDVVGNIEIPATNDYKYAAAKTNYATISPASFTALNGITISGNTYARWFSGGTAGTTDIMYATVQLPNGATITGMDAYVIDNNPSYDVTATLAVVNMATNLNVLLANTGSTSGASAAALMISATGLSQVVDNSTNTYYIMFNSRQNSPDLWIRGARVTYTVLKAD